MALVWLVFLVASDRAYPDVEEARRAHAAGNYRDAFVMFRRYARLGDTASRYELARAYLEGRGVSRNRPEGLAWLELARADGEPRAPQRYEWERARSTPDELGRAAARRQALVARYGIHAVAARLYPQPAPMPAREAHSNYERGAIRSGIEYVFRGAGCSDQMQISVEVTLDARGLPRDHIAAGTIFGESGVRTLVDDLACAPSVLRRARESARALRFDNAMLSRHTGMPRLVLLSYERWALSTGRTASTLLRHRELGGAVTEARAGVAAAQLGLASQLLTGTAVHQDIAKARRWITHATREGAPAAHYHRGLLELYCGDQPAALQAFRAGHALADHRSHRRLVWLLATSNDPSIRSPSDAVALSAPLGTDVTDLEAMDIRAAALASAGRFEEAVEVLDAGLSGAGDGPYRDGARARRAAYRRATAYVAPADEWRDDTATNCAVDASQSRNAVTDSNDSAPVEQSSLKTPAQSSPAPTPAAHSSLPTR